MSTNRSYPNAIRFVTHASWQNRIVPNSKRHEWSDFLTPFGWIAALATIGALMLGAAVGFAT